MTQKMTITSLVEYVKVIDNLGSEVCRRGKDSFCGHDILLFRGQSNIEWNLVPSIGRKNSCLYDDSVFWNEKNLVEKAKLEYPKVFCRNYSPIELLATMQHYGIPTRLLDVTENSLVALYFACEGCKNNDGEVFVFLQKEYRTDNSPVLEIVANTYDLMEESGISVNYLLEYAKEKMKIRTDRSVFRNACKSTNFVVAPKVDGRQIVQRSRYILFANKLDKTGNSLTTYIQELKKSDEGIVASIAIPHENKAKILKALKTIGISAKTLFPDDVSVGCKEIAQEFGYFFEEDIL